MTATAQDIRQLLDQATVKLTGASQSAIKAELYDTLREFFDVSSCWLEALTVGVVTTTTEYTLEPTGGQILRLIGVVDASGIAQPALMPTIGTLVLTYAPNKAQNYTVYVAKTVALPTDKAQIPEFPDWVLPVWAGGILDGLLGRAMNAANKSWGNPTLARYHLARFRDAMGRARTAALHRNSYDKQVWRFPGALCGNQRGGTSTAFPTRF